MSAIAPYEVGDLLLAAGAYTAGQVEGGVIRRATSVLVSWRYAQVHDPTDVAVGTAVNVDWRATIGGGGGLGPQAQTHGFGPRGVFNVEGDVRYSKDGTPYAIGPVAFANMLLVANEHGVPRALAPSWSYVAAPLFLADGAVVTHERTDVTLGGSSFVDSQVIGTVEDGTWDGTTNGAEMLSFLSMPFVLGGARVARRVAFDVMDLSSTWPTDHDAVGRAIGKLTGSKVDEGTGTVDEQVGLRIARLAGATTNVGILNGSATVHLPAVVTVDGPSATLPVDVSTVHLVNASDERVTLGSVPTIPDGSDGQRLALVNIGRGPVAVEGDGVLPGSNLARSRVLGPGAAVELTFSSSSGRWHELTPTGAEHDRPPEPGGRTVHDTSAATYALVPDDRTRIVVRSGGPGSTQVYPSDHAAHLPVGTEVPIINLGSEPLVHVAGEGARLVGAPTCPGGARQVATKVAADVWHLG